MTTDATHAPLPDTPGDETRAALRHLATVVATVLALCVPTYVVPALRPFRPYVPGAPVPILRHFLEDTSSVSGAGPVGTQTDATPAAPTTPAAPAPQARTDAPVVIAPADLAGIEHHVVDPGDRGLAPFYEALARTARGDGRAVTRITYYGDSSIALDDITGTVRRRLQTRFGDAGHGFVLVAKDYLPYRHVDVEHISNGGFRVQEVTRASRADGRYGLGGNVLRGGGGARSRFAPDPEAPVGRSVSRFELWYSTGPRFGDVELSVEGGSPQVVSTRADAPGEGVAVVELTDGVHELTVRALGLVELYGVVLERPGPGVVLDSMGLVGARANRLLHFDAAHIEAQLQRRGTNLLVLGFGGNEASDRIDPTRYEAEFEQVVRRMRGTRPDLGCLVVSPLDQAEAVGGAVRTFRGLPAIVEAQRAVAARTGCAFFDVFGAMGGSGGMARWYRANPRLATGDFRHATKEGYEQVGTWIERALLEGFAHWLAQTDGSR